MLRHKDFKPSGNVLAVKVLQRSGTQFIDVGISLVNGAGMSHGGIVAYPEYDARIERDHAYAVRVSQENESRKLTVYNHCEKSALATRTHGGDVNRRFCEFAFSGGPVRVDVAFCEDVKSKDAFIHGRGMMLDPFSDIFRFDQKKNTKRGFRRRETGGNRRVPRRRRQRTVRPLISR